MHRDASGLIEGIWVGLSGGRGLSRGRFLSGEAEGGRRDEAGGVSCKDLWQSDPCCGLWPVGGLAAVRKEVA